MEEILIKVAETYSALVSLSYLGKGLFFYKTQRKILSGEKIDRETTIWLSLPFPADFVYHAYKKFQFKISR